MDMTTSNGCLEDPKSPVKIIITEVSTNVDTGQDDTGQDMNSSYYSTEGAIGQDQSYDTEFSETDVVRDVSHEEEQFADARERFSLDLDLSGIKEEQHNEKVITDDILSGSII